MTTLYTTPPGHFSVTVKESRNMDVLKFYAFGMSACTIGPRNENVLDFIRISFRF
jgi:hypothetical protein